MIVINGIYGPVCTSKTSQQFSNVLQSEKVALQTFTCFIGLLNTHFAPAVVIEMPDGGQIDLEI